MTSKNSALKKEPEETPADTYPPETAKFMTWTVIRFIKSPTSHMLDLTCFVLMGTLLVCLFLSQFIKVDIGERGPAEITAQGGVKEIVSPIDGQIIKIFKKNGEPVKEQELIALLQMNAITPDELQGMIDVINKMTRTVENESTPENLEVSPLTIPTSKIYDPSLLKTLVDVEHSIHNFKTDRIRTLILRKKQGFNKNSNESEVFFANRRIKDLTKRLKDMRASPQRSLLASYIDSTEEELGRLKTQVNSAQTKASTVLDQSYSDLLRSLRIANGALDDFKRLHEIRAPISGIIGKIIDGENIHATLNQPIATIIPENAHFIARIKMKSKALSQLKEGQNVYYKVEAYPFQRFGLFTGEVINFDQLKEARMDEKGIQKEAGDSFVLNASIKIPENLNPELQRQIKFIVGMEAEATVVTERKSIKDIILDKFFNKKEIW